MDEEDVNENIVNINWSKYGKEASQQRHDLVVRTGVFSTVAYQDVLDYQIGPNWIAVSMKDGVVHFHPTNKITYIKSYTIKETE
jgi:hypothetical protein